jgi:hypothetical protein
VKPFLPSFSDVQRISAAIGGIAFKKVANAFGIERVAPSVPDIAEPVIKRAFA